MLLSLLAVAVLLAPVSACNVPVFRYALEHWSPDDFRVTVHHEGKLSADAAQALELLRVPGVALWVVDHAGRSEARLVALPWLSVCYPASAPVQGEVWSGRLTTEAVRALLDSPARQAIVRQLQAGASAVWVFLACGDAARDGPSRATLEAELRRMEAEDRLPELTTLPEDRVALPVPLRLAFPVVSLNRSEASEAMLVRMLLASEGDLADRNEPMAFPVFGRGRILHALAGAGITPANVRQSGAFLTGSCSCMVKRENPGTDLLLAADWGPLADEPQRDEVAPGTSIAVPMPSAPRSTAGDPVAPRWLLGLGIVLASVAAIGTGLRLRARRTSP